MNIKNPVLWLVVYFILVNILDIFTFVHILPAEGNPLYLMTKSIYLLIAFKLFVVGSVVYFILCNKYTSHFIYFVFLTIIVYGSLLVTLGVASNIYGIMNPELVEAASNISASNKSQEYGFFITLLYLIPASLTLLIFKFYQWSVKHILIIKK